MCACPDLFPPGSRWALVYLHEGTQLRLADSPRGPWIRPPRETLDKGLTAGRTLTDGRRRLIFGWLYDNGWGGDMLTPRELFLHSDGSAASRCAAEIVAACRAAPDATAGQEAEVFGPRSGAWRMSRDSAAADVPVGRSAVAVWPAAPSDCYLEARLRMAPEARACIVLRRKTTTLEEAMAAILFDPAAQAVAICNWNLWGSCDPRGPETTAPHDFPAGAETFVQVVMRGEILEVFFDG